MFQRRPRRTGGERGIEVDLRDYLRILKYRWPVILAVTVAVAGASVAFTKQQPSKYQARAHLFLVEMPYYYGSDRAGMASLTYSKGAHAELMKTREVMEKAIRPAPPGSSRPTLTEYYPEAKNEGADLTEEIEDLRARFAVAAMEAIGQLTLTMTDLDAERAKATVNAVSEAYRESSMAHQLNHVDRTIEFVERRVETLRKENQTLTGNLEKLGPSPAAMPATLEEQALIDRIRDLRNQIFANEKKLAELEGEITYLNSVAASRTEPLPAEAAQGDSARLWIRMAEREEQFRADARRYNADYPPMVELRKEIERLRQEHLSALDREAQRMQHDALNRVLVEIRTRVTNQRTLQRTQGELQTALTSANREYDQRLTRSRSPEEEAAARLESQRRDLREEIQGIKAQIVSLEDSRNDLSISRQLITSPVSKIEFATATIPILPTPSRALPLLILLGVMLGIGSAWLMEFLSNRVHTEYDVRRYVNLPLLGSILKIRNEAERLLVSASPQSPLSEVFHTIAALLEGHAAEKSLRSFVIASSNPEEGKSTVVANLATALARGGARVVIVDADLRKAMIHRFLNVENETGLSSWLQDGGNAPVEDLIRPTSVENLSVIPAGPHLRSPVTLLKSESMRLLLDRLKERFDYVFVDVPPVRIAADTLLLASRVDGVLLLVSAGETSKDDVTHTKRLIESARGKLVAAVLNKMTIHSRGYYYYYQYYDYGYRYYGRAD